MIKESVTFLQEDVWRMRRKDLPRFRSIGLKVLRVILYSFRGFQENRCSLAASALTYFTMLSIVPLFAMAFGIAQGFGLEELLENEIREQIRGQDEVIAYIIEFSNKMLENTSGGLIAGIGVGILFFTVIRLLGNIESSLNGIWGVVEHRTWVRKFSDYLAIVVVCPVLMIAASSLNVFIIGWVKSAAEGSEIVGLLFPTIKFVLKLSPFVILWLLFSLIFVVIPNTRVSILAGIVGGVAGGTIFQWFQLFYINVMAGMLTNSAVYGGFAALPLFLVWLQISWMIMLYGAEVSFAFQHVDTYELEPDSASASERFRRLSALRITNLIVKSFVDGSGAVKEESIQKALEIPSRLIKELLFKLEEAGVIVEVKQKDSSRIRCFSPAKDPEILTVGFVISAVEHNGLTEMPINETPEVAQLKQTLRKFDEECKAGALAIALKDI